MRTYSNLEEEEEEASAERLELTGGVLPLSGYDERGLVIEQYQMANCIYEYVGPRDHVRKTVQRGAPRAKEYSFKLDVFQEKAIECIEREESVLVSAHTSAGKTAVAEYAIAKALARDQRVIYTSPIKALSNQKYRDLSEQFQDVGLMTGDVTLNENASCIVMTTEILRSMLYRGSEITREMAWVIFDEVHYMRDKERGVVWEETIIMLPASTVKYVFLSATIPNAREFAEWIATIKKQPCNVVYTDFRPVPLQHYLHVVGGDGIYLVVDESGSFREEAFNKAIAVLDDDLELRKAQERRAKKPSEVSEIKKIVGLIMQKQFEPCLVFSFSKRECESHALSLAKSDFNGDEEKRAVEAVFKAAVQTLAEED